MWSAGDDVILAKTTDLLPGVFRLVQSELALGVVDECAKIFGQIPHNVRVECSGASGIPLNLDGVFTGGIYDVSLESDVL